MTEEYPNHIRFLSFRVFFQKSESIFHINVSYLKRIRTEGINNLGQISIEADSWESQRVFWSWVEELRHLCFSLNQHRAALRQVLKGHIQRVVKNQARSLKHNIWYSWNGLAGLNSFTSLSRTYVISRSTYSRNVLKGCCHRKPKLHLLSLSRWIKG